MKFTDIKTTKVWIVSEKRLVSLADLPVGVDDIYSDEYVIFRRSDFVDRHNKPIYEGHILRMNPNDDDWLDVVVFKEYLRLFENGISSPKSTCIPVHRLELLGYEGWNKATNVSLESAVHPSNPAEIAGHVMTHPHLLFEIL